MKLLIDIPEHIYEHAKESSEDSRDEFDAMRAIANGTQQESRSENPNTCGDAISRQAVLDGLASIAKAKAKSDAQKSLMGRVMFFTEQLPSVTPQPCEDAISRREALNAITMAEVRWQAVDNVNKLPSVSPQQRTGRWIEKDIHNCHTSFKCSECDYTYNFMHLYGKPTADYTYCPNCGAKMEVEE